MGKMMDVGKNQAVLPSQQSQIKETALLNVK
jgi:hypothetical protein